MRLVSQTKLQFQEGNSDKVYEVDLCEAGDGEYVVNFRYGRRGQRLREGTKTAFPETREKAQEIFDKLVASKVKKGYRESLADGDEPSPQVVEVAETTPAGADPRSAKLGAHLASAAAGSPPRRWKLSRILWRAGEVDASANLDAVLAISPRDEMEAYTQAWALGRSGDTRAVARLRELYEHDAEKVRRIAGEALLLCLPPADRAALSDDLHRALPSSLRDALSTQPPSDEDRLAALTRGLEGLVRNGALDGNALYTLYTQSYQHPEVREALHTVLAGIELKAPWFRGIRHIFKAAELRRDAEIFGVIAWRFENAPQTFTYPWVWDQELRKSVNIRDEIGRPDSRYAYGRQTREYLRRRVCRTLRRAGELQDPTTFITLATGVLLAYDDEVDKKAPRADYEYFWDPQTRRGESREKWFGPYAGRRPLHYLLYANSDRYELRGGKTWAAKGDYKPTAEVGEELPPKREEACPEFWDHAPDAIALLLRESRCGAVHSFAAGVWRANPGFDDKADADFVLALLNQPYPVTQDLAIDIAEKRFDPAEPDAALVLALLRCDLERGRSLALGWLRQCKDPLLADGQFLGELLLVPHADVHTGLREVVGAGSVAAEVLEVAVPVTVAGLLDLPDDEEAAAQAQLTRESLLLVGGDHLGSVSTEVVRDLLAHPLEENVVLGAQLLRQRGAPAEEIPDEIWELMLNSESESVRATGMDLFAELGDNALLERAEVLASLCLSPHPDVRAAARPVVERLASQNAGFAQDMVLQFYPIVLRQEEQDGLHDDVFALLSGPLREHLGAIPAESCFRMMESRYPAGQQLGFIIFKDHIDPAEVPMRQMARLGGQDHLEGRQFVWDYYRNNPDHVRAEKADALRVLDTDWEDTRDFAFAYFREDFAEEDWDPDTLVGLCDSVRPEVQDFGKETITRFFKEEDGPRYLLKLSQHPTPELQGFASNYLERFAKSDPARLAELEPYLTTVLSQVRRARVAKDRVLAFLESEALADEAAAKVVYPILQRASATISIRDHAACVRAMHAIAGVHGDPLTKEAGAPDEPHLRVIEPPVYQHD